MQTTWVGERATFSLPIRALVAALPVAAVAVAGSRVTLPAIPVWYADLVKPPFTPPNVAFGPAWTILYVLIAASFFMILSAPRREPGRKAAFTFHGIQLALNCLWSFAFFGARSPILGLAVIAALVVAIVATIAAFRRVDETAALLLLPYLGWVLFATYLNVGVLALNGSP